MPEVCSSQPTGETREPVPFIDLVEQYNAIAADVQAAVDRVMREQKFILGDEVAEFECDMAEYCDSRAAIGCASGTDALILALMAHDIGPGHEVITTPFSFFATASCICRVGAKPVFVDIDPESFNLDPARVEAAITERTRAILPVHLFGQCADMEPLWRIAVRDRLTIIEDACQAVGAEYRGRRAGVLGTCASFSFFPTKNLGGAGDGGLITTDDAELAKRMRRLRVHGDSGGYNHVEIGLNSRLDALQAAILRVKLEHLDAWTISRQLNAKRYGELFLKRGLLDAIELPTVLSDRLHVFNQYCIRVKNGTRNHILQSLREKQIGAAIYYPVPLHLQECFHSLGYRAGDFPETEKAAGEILALPIYPELKRDHQDIVVQGIADALATAANASPATLQPSFNAQRRVA